MRYIKTLKDGDRINDIYLCKQRNAAVTKNGKNYDNVILQDKTGTIDAKIWDPYSEGIEDSDALDYVHVVGDVSLFNGQLQVSIKRLRVADEDEYEKEDFFPVSSRSADEMKEELMGYIAEVENTYLKQLLDAVFVDSVVNKMLKHSAAKSVHHAFIGGLMEHSLSVTKTCKYFASQYDILNKDLLITVGLLHDIGKLKELDAFPANDYTDEGNLLGHIVMGTQMIDKVIEKIPGFPKQLRAEVLHCILAHHGELEYGSPKKPALAEALALNFADNVDAKMETIKELFADVNDAAWLGYNRLLETNIRRTGMGELN